MWHEDNAQQIDPDREMVLLAQSGDIHAFNHLVAKYRLRVHRAIAKITQDRADAEDQTQNTFLLVFQKLHTFQGLSKFSSWLTRIAINQALMELRRRRRDVTVYLHCDEEIASFMLDVREWRSGPEDSVYGREIERNIALLPRSLSEILYLRHYRGLSMKEAARALNISEQAAKSRVLRARHMLKQRLEFSRHSGEPLA